MKIAYLITGMFNSAGMERVVANKANYWASTGNEVMVITTDQNNRPDFYELHPSVVRHDLNINFFQYDKYPIGIRFFCFIWKRILFKRRLSALLYESRCDVVVSLILRSTDFLYKIKDGSRKFIEHHFSRYYASLFSDSFSRNKLGRFIYSVRGRMEERSLKKYDSFIVLTKEDAEMWGTMYKNLVVIPNFLTFIPQHTSPCNNKTAVAIGRLEYQKGFDTLLQIWHQVSPVGWKLDIYGDGADKEMLSRYIKEHGMESSVTLHPVTANVQDVLKESSLYLMTSRFEGFPMVLIEAMACGVPPISFACKCGPRDIITDGEDGFIVEEGDVSTFGKKLKVLTENDDLRRKMGKAASQNIQRFSQENVMALWKDLFKSKN